jgi:CoA:oxalate CoA-transferase
MSPFQIDTMTTSNDSTVAHAAGGEVQSPPGAPSPLTGVRVLDLGDVFQGPYATFLMAMARAGVIKIEPPRGGMSRRGRDGDLSILRT